MVRAPKPAAPSWDLAKKHWRLRFTWNQKRYDFSCSTIPKNAKVQAQYWAEARANEVKSGKWESAQITGTEPNAELELIARAFLAERSGGVVSADWSKTQKLHLETHLLPHFKRLSDVTKGTISTWQANRLKVVTWETVKKERSTLRQLLEFAEEKGLLGEVPAFPKRPGKSVGTRHKQGRVGPTEDLTAEMAEALIMALPEFSRRSRKDGIAWPLRGYLAVMYETSLRPKFWARFRVGKHWSPGRKVLRITQDSDKNRWGRTVPLSETAIAVLESLPVQKDGQMFSDLDFRVIVRSTALKLKLPPEVVARVHPYDMRHQAVTRFANSEGGILGAAFLAGHKRVTTTNRYSHAKQEHAALTVASSKTGIVGVSIGGPSKKTSKKVRGRD